MNQPGVYRPGYQPTTSYGSSQAVAANNVATHEEDRDDEAEEEEVRKPVQYRF